MTSDERGNHATFEWQALSFNNGIINSSPHLVQDP
jgi:hypothetical protein